MGKNTSPPLVGRDNPLLAAALKYAERGFHVFPVYEIYNGACTCKKKARCEHPGKHPRFHPKDLTNGHKNATTDKKLIELWWRRWPRANIGIATGRLSGIIVLDIDPRNGGDVGKLPFKLPTTVMVRTGGGGTHFYFKYPEGVEVSCVPGIFPGIDLKGEGGYVLGPPSNHVSQIQDYTWELPPTGGYS